MKEKGQYYVLKEKAVPDVLLRVVEAKRLLDSGKTDSVQDATEQVGISRSSFYKYKDDIFPFHETAKGKTITMVIQLDDEPGQPRTSGTCQGRYPAARRHRQRLR